MAEMVPQLWRKSGEKGDSVTPLDGHGWWITAEIGIVSLFCSLMMTLIRFLSSWINWVACWFHAHRVSMEMGTILFLSFILAYLEVFKVASWLASTAARLDVLPMWDLAIVSTTVTSPRNCLSSRTRNECRSIRSLAVITTETDWLPYSGNLSSLTALQLMSFRCEYLWCLVALFRQERPCKPLASTPLP